MTERRMDRRRSNRMALYLVEKRRGKAWMYGSVVLCIALMAYLMTSLLH